MMSVVRMMGVVWRIPVVRGSAGRPERGSGNVGIRPGASGRVGHRDVRWVVDRDGGAALIVRRYRDTDMLRVASTGNFDRYVPVAVPLGNGYRRRPVVVVNSLNGDLHFVRRIPHLLPEGVAFIAEMHM